MNTDTIYITGITPEGIPLIGGIWRLYRQEGFPVDISLMILRENELLPDIMELFMEATYHAELPQMKKQAPELFTPENIKRFMVYLEARGESESNQFDVAQKILMEKRQNAVLSKDCGKVILYCLKLRRELAAGKK